MFDNLNKMANKYGLKFKGENLISNTHSALLASEYAKEKGRFHEFHNILFYTYFTQGRNIADLDLLISLGETIGLNKDEMLKKIKDGSYEGKLSDAKKLALEYGIRSTPTFIISDAHIITGAQSLELFKKVLSK